MSTIATRLGGLALAEPLTDLSDAELTVLRHGSSGGHFLLCECAYCALAKRADQIAHAANCGRRKRWRAGYSFTPACAAHADIRCHCDCGRR